MRGCALVEHTDHFFRNESVKEVHFLGNIIREKVPLCLSCGEMEASLISMLSVGSSVRIHARAPSTHAGETGKVLVMPVHPITWFKIRLDGPCGDVAMFRSSNLIPLTDRGEVRQEYLMSRLSQAQTRTSRVSNNADGGVPPPSMTVSDGESGGGGGRPLRKRMHVSTTTDDDADPYVIESDCKPRRRPCTAPKPPPASNRAPAMGAFDSYGACLNCGVLRWTAGRFCWNELCSTSPIYWKLPGCGQTPQVSEVVNILAFMAFASVAAPSPAAPPRVRADSSISSDSSESFASTSSSLQSLA